MRIVWTDNYGRSGESPGKDEKFVAKELTDFYARRIVKLLNDSCSESGSDYFKVVEDDYQLLIFEP